jgi:hypothetical protein
MSSSEFSEFVKTPFELHLLAVLEEMRWHYKEFHRLARLAGLFFEMDGTAKTVGHRD